jgi:SAM-dependent methyltransferase
MDDAGKGSDLFAGTALDGALERQRSYAGVFDAGSRRILAAAGLTEGMRCLEVDSGAGAGELAAWLAERVGQGNVVALSSVAPFAAGTPAASAGLAALAPASFDLLHGRAALAHVPQFTEALAALLRLLRPGGWLVLEEPDFSAARAFTGSFDQRHAFTSVNRAREALFRAARMDFGFGTRLPGLFQARGLEALQMENDAPLVCGGTPHAALVAAEVVNRAEEYRGTGLVSAQELDHYLSFAADPACWAIPHATLRAAGRKPAR